MDKSCYSLSLFLGSLSFLFLLLEKAEIGWTLLITGGILFLLWLLQGLLSLLFGGDPLRGLECVEEEKCFPSS